MTALRFTNIWGSTGVTLQAINSRYWLSTLPHLNYLDYAVHLGLPWYALDIEDVITIYNLKETVREKKEDSLQF